MDTAKNEEEIRCVGARFRGRLLVEQARYTLPVVEADPAVRATAGPVTGDVRTIAERVEAALQDPALVADEQESGCCEVAEALRLVKVWLRRLSGYGAIAALTTAKVPESLGATAYAGQSVERAIDTVAERRALAAPYADILVAVGMPPDFLEEGATLCAALRDTDERAGSCRDGHAPIHGKVARYRYEKGLLYLGLKVLNHVGRTIHADDPGAAGAFNLSILYRSAE